MRSVLVKSVDIEVTYSGTCIEPRDGFLDLEKRSIPLMIKAKEKYTAERIRHSAYKAFYHRSASSLLDESH